MKEPINKQGQRATIDPELLRGIISAAQRLLGEIASDDHKAEAQKTLREKQQ